jgi:hypothetical protein
MYQYESTHDCPENHILRCISIWTDDPGTYMTHQGIRQIIAKFWVKADISDKTDATKADISDKTDASK